MTYDYRIAGLLIRCRIPFSLRKTPESAPFMEPAGGAAEDISFRFCPMQELPAFPADENWIENRLHQCTDDASTVWFRQTPGDIPYARVSHGFQSLECAYRQGSEHLMELGKNVVDLMSLETLLLDHRGFMLHCAFVRLQEMGILFSGPSGIGKSTQAALWETHLGSETINGDRAAVRYADGKWQAWGIPYAGTSGIYRNESAPIRAVVMLQQSKENRIRKLTAPEAFRQLYPQVTIHRWDPDFTRMVSDLLLEFMNSVPVYLLECRPDVQAVQLLHQTLTKGE